MISYLYLLEYYSIKITHDLLLYLPAHRNPHTELAYFASTRHHRFLSMGTSIKVWSRPSAS